MRQTYDRRTNGGTNCISPTLTSRTDTNSRHAATAPRNKSAIFYLQFPPQVPAINHFALLPCIPCFPWFNSLKPSQIASFTKSTLVSPCIHDFHTKIFFRFATSALKTPAQLPAITSNLQPRREAPNTKHQILQKNTPPDTTSFHQEAPVIPPIPRNSTSFLLASQFVFIRVHSWFPGKAVGPYQIHEVYISSNSEIPRPVSSKKPRRSMGN